MRLGVGAALVGGELVPGDVEIDGEGRVAAIGMRPGRRGDIAAPGFVDLQVNGFGGVDFLAADPIAYERAGRLLAATGVTAYQPTFISSPVGDYRRALKVVSGLPPAPGGPRVLGIHLEGPFISPLWPGAHNPAHILDPDISLAESLCEAGPVTCVTLAPERAGGLELIRTLVGRGLVVAIGHSDADATTAHAAFDAGAGAVTHVYNAHRRWSARDPGLAGAALARPDVVVQVIVDHVHLAPETSYAAYLAARGRFALVTDAISATGLGPGTYALGDRRVHVSGSEARLADGTLAGSVLTMIDAVRNLAGMGAPIEEALGAASTVPAQLVGRRDIGDLAAGAPADIVVLDDSLSVKRTLVAGSEIFAA